MIFVFDFLEWPGVGDAVPELSVLRVCVVRVCVEGCLSWGGLYGVVLGRDCVLCRYLIMLFCLFPWLILSTFLVSV